MRITVALDGDEAGRKASARFLQEVVWWARPKHPAEPISQLTATLEREISRLGAVAEAHLAEPQCEGRDRRINDVEHDLDILIEYWREVRHGDDTITADSRARTADEYVALEAAALVPIDRGPRIDYAGIKAAIPIEDHIGRFTNLRRTGHNLTGRCPLPGHEDSSPSLTVYPATRSFYCFGCQRGGDIFDFEEALGARELTA